MRHFGIAGWLRARVVPGGRFLTVGALGLVVNQVLLWALVEGAHLYYLVAAILASQGSTLFNFVGVEVWAFDARRHPGGLWRRFLAFDLMNSTSLLVRVPMLFVLTSGLHLHYLLSNLVTIAILTVTRFVIADGVIWPARPAPGRQAS